MSSNDTACSAQLMGWEEGCERGGVCNVSSGACECIPGWTNVGDFSLNPKGACDLFIEAILGLWIAQVTIALLSIVYSMYILYKRHRKGSMIERKTWRVGIVPFCQIIACSLTIPVVVLKYVDFEQFSVGNSVTQVVLTTLFIWFIAIALLCGLTVLMKTSMSLLPSQSEQLSRLKKNAHIIRRLMVFIAFVGFILVWAPILMIIDPSLNLLAAKLLGIGLGGMMFLIGTFLGSFFVSRLITGIEETLIAGREMQRTTSPAFMQLEKLALKLKVVRVFQVGGFFFSTLILLIFCFVPYLMKKASYVYPLFLIAGILAVDILLWSHQNRTPKERSNSSVANNNTLDWGDPSGPPRRKTGWGRLSLPTVEF